MPFPRLSDVAVTQDTLATIDREPRISADSHMTEPPDLWETRLPAALRERAPRFLQRDDVSSGRVRAGGWDPYERLKDQAYDSISAEVLYPTPGALAWGDFTTPSGGLYPGRPLGDCANIVCVVAQGSARCCNSGGATRKQGGA
jgi:hypothetical protein